MANRLDGARLDELWDFADPAASAQRFRAESAGDPARSELETQVARALGLQGDFAAGHAVLDAIGSTDPVVTIRIALERGRLLNSSGRPDEAVGYFSAALETAVERGEDFLAVDAAHMLGIAQPESSAEWTERGIRIVEATSDDRTKRWAIALHNNRGWALHDEEHFDKALAEFERADAAAQAHGNQEQQHVARWAIARCLRSLGRFPEALAIQEQLFISRPDDEYVVEELEALRAQQ